jgi:hypothetical protein
MMFRSLCLHARGFDHFSPFFEVRFMKRGELPADAAPL